MNDKSVTRRWAIAGAMGAGFAISRPNDLWAQTDSPAPIVVTGAGKVRGRRAGDVSIFLGIPYGANTASCRFQPAKPAPSWTGVRECLSFGPQAPQGIINPGETRALVHPSPFLLKTMTIFRASLQQGNESENCLVLNVFTPHASSRQKRPVMVWLHGGGFVLGSSGEAQYDGSALCRDGDVVVVTLNHRLGALGYLYLGALSDEFADSGNIGQLDIIQALQWVRDNIAAFGGDPGNVTIFGESGGGQKVSTLLAMPPAQGLFHKAIIQSGPAVIVEDKAAASAMAERTLAALGLKKTDLPQIETIDYHTLIKAAAEAAGPGGSTFKPVVDGRSLPANPFNPVAPAMSRGIPVIIGTNKDEATLFFSPDPDFETMTAAQAHDHFVAMLGGQGDAAFKVYSEMHPHDPPTYWVTALMTDRMFRMDSITIAERKSSQHVAPVYMYRLDWQTPILDGVMRTPHGLDVPLVFDNVDKARALVGPGPQPQQLANTMSRSWLAFVHSGNPSCPGLSWPAYDSTTRQTMIFNLDSHVVSDPDSAARKFWSA
jgi:para-nitrobenzyl esterase